MHDILIGRAELLCTAECINPENTLSKLKSILYSFLGSEFTTLEKRWLCLQCLGPFAFFDVRGKENLSESQSSLVNEMEAEMVVSLYIALMQRHPELKADTSSIAIISPYKAQVRLAACQFIFDASV